MDAAATSTTYMREWVRAEFVRQTGHAPSEAALDSLLAQMAARDERWAHTPQLSREAVHDYWRSAQEMGNTPQDYLDAPLERSQFLLELLRLCGLDAPTVLEIGCNAGRNLAHLLAAGYTDLSGIEISPDAIALLRASHPRLAQCAKLYVAPVEEVIAGFADAQFDVVFSMAVLVHLHCDSDWVFPEIARITRECLITIEDERNETPRHFLRNYQQIFEPLGLVQVLRRDCSHIAGLGPYTARLFRR